jgi:hypothetical protein
MNLRLRKLIGTFAVLAFLVCYALAAMAVGGAMVTGSGRFVELVFFAAAGVAWMPVAMVMIKWMNRHG